MQEKICNLKREKKYDEIIKIASSLSPEKCDSAETAHAIGKAYEKLKAFKQSIPWHLRCFELDPADETLGMVLGVCLAMGELDVAQKALEKDEFLQGGYYYSAGICELAFRKQKGLEEEIEAIETFLDVQDEESYLARLANLYLQAEREKEAKRVCKKIKRLYITGDVVDYASKLQEEIESGNGLEYVKANPWKNNYVFKHLKFDLSCPSIENVQIENQESAERVEEKTEREEIKVPVKKQKKEEKKEKISPIIEKAFEDVVGMQELKSTLNMIFNIMQMEKKRVGCERIIKNNIQILGPDGCGKTTAAKVTVNALEKMGVIGKATPAITDYFSLIGGSKDETCENIKTLFENAVNSCVLIENIHEFNDSGAYSLGLDAIDQIVKAYYAAEENIPLIITGSEKGIAELFAKKPKFEGVFNLPNVILGKYTTEELVKIADKMAEKSHLVLEEKAKDLLAEKLENLSKQIDFKYSRDLDSIINKAYIKHASKVGSMRRIKDLNEVYILRADDFENNDSVETVEELLEELDSLIGLSSAKEQVRRIVNQVQVQKMKKEAGIVSGSSHGSLHLVFLGNAGTGKTTVARIVGKIYKRLGVLPTGQLIECTRKDLVSQYVGATSQKVADKVKEAMGGILFIDEAYALCKDDNDTYGREAIDALIADIENHRDNLMVILAGYSNDMDKFMDQNQGLRSRIPTNILFEDYTTEEMVEIFKRNVKKDNKRLAAGLEQEIYQLIEEQKKAKNFGNARGVRNLYEQISLNMDDRLGQMDPEFLRKNDFCIIKKEDLPTVTVSKEVSKSVEDYLNELYDMTGLAKVKEKVRGIVAQVQVNKKMEEMNITTQPLGTLHMVFKGNAGTGKTTVARLIGGIYKELGVLSSGHLVECGRSDLVGQYIGQTAPKVKAKVQEAMGGILFIDEAYTLAKGGDNDFGKEAIDTLVADIENYRKDLMVIVAGYSEDMDLFMSQNQGLSSRFPNEILFEDYSSNELLSIFKNMIKSKSLIMKDDLDECALELVTKYSGKSDFGNARGIRNLVDKICEQRSNRLFEMMQSGCELTREQFKEVLKEDLERFL